MPVFGYKCVQCDHEFEVLYKTQSAVEREEPTEKCPECGSEKKERDEVPKRTSFQLKGKWFKEGY